MGMIRALNWEVNAIYKLCLLVGNQTIYVSNWPSMLELFNMLIPFSATKFFGSTVSKNGQH